MSAATPDHDSCRESSKYKYSDQVGWFAFSQGAPFASKRNAQAERRFVYGEGDALEEHFMPTAYFHAKAEQCRGLLKLATDRRVIEQLRLWISDFEADAALIRRRAATSDHRSRAVVAVISDEIDVGSQDSFPASDAPSWTSVTRLGRPAQID